MFEKIKSLIPAKKGLGSSLGVVTRNYAKRPRFEPERQVSGITYKAIDKIGLTLSVYQPQVKNQSGDVVNRHPLLPLFDTPNPRLNGSDFVHLYGMLMQIYGETFWYKARGENTRKVKELYLLDPGKVELKVSGGELVGYVLHKSNGQQVPFLPEEIHHDFYPNPFNEWRGLSVVERAAIYINTEIITATFTLNYMNNNASPSGIVTLPDMDKPAFKQFTQQWREGYEGPENAGKTAFIRGGEAGFKAVGATLKDVDQEVTRNMSKDDVLLMLDVPKEVLGQSKDTGFGRNTVEAFDYVFSKNKLEPMMRRLDRIYQPIAIELSGQAVTVDHESPIPEDKEHQLAVYKEAINKWMTPNEIRAEMGLEPVKGGDDLKPENATPSISLSAKRKTKVKLKKDEVRKITDEQEEFRDKLVKTNDTYAKRMKSAISQFADEQSDRVLAKMDKSQKTFEEWLFGIKEESEELAAVLSPIVFELMEDQAEGVANFITGELVSITPELKREVEHDILRISGIYNEDTLRELEKTLSAGQAEGESLNKLKKRVTNTYGDAKGYRAERVARTESLRASNRTAEFSYKQNGFNKVEWFINPGACEFCRTYEGRQREIGGKFTTVGDVVTGDEGGQLRIDYDDIDVPPLHPQCRCSIVPV